MIGRFTADLFGRHVPVCPKDHPCRRRLIRRSGSRGRRRSVVVDQARDAEVQDLQAAVGGDEQVLRFEIPVNDAVIVRHGQRLRRLLAQIDRRGGFGHAPMKTLSQCLAFEQLRHDERTTLGLTDIVDADDARVVQAAGRACLELEAVEHIGIGGGRRGEYFNGDVAAEAFVSGPVDFAHRSGAERSNDFIRAEAHAGVQPHRTAGILSCVLPCPACAMRPPSSNPVISGVESRRLPA
jgi:hypothetical protein